MKKTNLLQEAIIEARELKEAAEHSVKQQLMEELSPLIKKTLETQFSSLLKEQDQFGVEEEPALPVTTEVPQAELPMADLPVSPVVSNAVSDSSDPEPVATQTDLAPEADHTVNISLPDANGQITVSVNDLFTKPNEVIKAVDSLPPPQGEVSSVAPETTEVTPEVPLAESTPKAKFLKLLEVFVAKEKSYEKISNSQAMNIEMGLIALLENGKELLENGLIESTDYVLCKKRAEKIQNSLQEKLNTALEQNSYNIENIQDSNGEKMAIKKTLKDLFEETEIAFDDVNTEKAVKDAEAKQKKLNGQDPGQNPGNAEVGKSKEGDWNKDGAAAAASDSAAAKTALEEALELFKAALSLNEDEAAVSDGDAGASDGDAGASFGADEGSSSDEGEEEFDIEALLKDFEEQLASHGVSLDKLDVDVAGEKEGGDEFELSFDLDDEGKVEPADAGASADDEAEGLVIAEAIETIKKAKKALSESKQEKSDLELYNQKTVYFNKLLLRETVKTAEEKKAAVVALDRATTLQEVEKIYNKIVAHQQQAGKVAGNGKASAGTKNGMISESAKSGKETLTEGNDPFVQRLQTLAKII